VKRGQSSTVVVLAFLALLVTLILPLLLQLHSSYTAHLLGGLPEPGMVAARLSAYATIGELSGVAEVDEELTVVVRNRSGRGVAVEVILAYVTCGDSSTLVTLGRSIYLGPQSELKIVYSSERLQALCPGGASVDAVYLVTSEGSVVPLSTIKPTAVALPPPEGGGELSEVGLTRSIKIIPVPVSPSDSLWSPISVLGRYFTVATLDGASNPTRVVTSAPSMVGTRIWTLSRSASGTSLTIDSQQVYNVWVGYDPRNTSRYNILITARGISLRLGGGSESPCGDQYVRVFVYGFVSEDSRGILSLGGKWVRYPSDNVANYTFLGSQGRDQLYLRGRAERVLVYCRTTGSTSSYEPYLMLVSTALRGGAGVLFTTIDRTYGSYTTRNDYEDILLDSSANPLALVYKTLTISNRNYTAVAITVNYRFHDNEGSDALGTSVDLPILLVGLVDEYGNIYSYRSYSFRELTRYEDTYPPEAQAQSSVIFIPLPPRDVGERVFYVFIALQDPYLYRSGSYLDDVDFTLLVEGLAVVLFT